MVAYFKWQHYLWIGAGACAGLAIGAATYGKIQAGYADIFFAALMVFAGVVAGRIASSVWANRKLSRLTAILYRDCRPEEFLNKFSPIVARTPENTAEYIDGRIKMAYACEAMGDFEKGLELLEGLNPAGLRLHSLSCQALTVNQRLRLQLLMEDREGAQESREELESLRQTARERVPRLASNLAECLRLAEIWLDVLNKEPADEQYLESEADLARNRIHKSEMQLLLAEAFRSQKEDEKARKKLKEACETGKGLYAGRKAEQILLQRQDPHTDTKNGGEIYGRKSIKKNPGGSFGRAVRDEAGGGDLPEGRPDPDPRHQRGHDLPGI